MAKILDEILYDLRFIKSHTVQPKWFKILKIFILLGVIFGYYYFFGIKKVILFIIFFLLINVLLHLLYRINTKKFQQNWMDFRVEKTENGVKAKSIGKMYYTIVFINTSIAILISQLWG